MTTIYGSTLAADVIPPLSYAQTECTLFKAEGKTDDEIAIITDRSARTVKAHVTTARQRLNADNAAHLVTKAFLADILHKLPMLAFCAMTISSNVINNALAGDEHETDMMRTARTLRGGRPGRTARGRRELEL